MLELYIITNLDECALVLNNVVVATADPEFPEEGTQKRLISMGEKLAEALSEPLVIRNASSENWPDNWGWDEVIALLDLAEH